LLRAVNVFDIFPPNPRTAAPSIVADRSTTNRDYPAGGLRQLSIEEYKGNLAPSLQGVISPPIRSNPGRFVPQKRNSGRAPEELQGGASSAQASRFKRGVLSIVPQV
jgi:hypothetical protein